MATQLESSLHISDLILQASPVVQLVMLVLVLASVFSWYLIAKLHMGYKKARQGDDHFQKIFWSGAELNTLYNNAQLNSKRDGLEDIFYQGLSEYLKLKKRQADTVPMIEGTERILRVGLSRDQGRLEQGLSALASIGSVAPYVGLFGTVWGIMSAFIGLAQVEQVTLATVAPGIAEALIATAIGLFAAIPAVLAFNHYTAKGEEIYSDRALFAEEMVALLQRQSVGTTQEAE
ncbi:MULTISPECIES: protein TolQ [Acinetobacter]|jgi:biopolymer transport protein TolQ|uniref:Tol-Pal system protein TolQ n=3 Tax=Acinetobacter bereziniae TaxID=106648 RepID=A0A0A8TGY4_ACIBZ|nr:MULTISPECIES: protein TolQ [Acinetobacter]MBJ9953604.1 protein TolQ [Acinetobacter baumannii]MEC8125511.1 protein TolQ [Pseudomonadota bacterium]ELW78692.1 protein TolQ [Acinetobacter sp. WC-743]ENV20346.1 protein TolQ [Acinetobacter bereziniae NIPH 3]ENV94468.1 protein TolQ [Acinetobacter bereziniae LMG 1003 = CIP 70.12]